jgi:hypothetical protein
MQNMLTIFILNADVVTLSTGSALIAETRLGNNIGIGGMMKLHTLQVIATCALFVGFCVVLVAVITQKKVE